MMFHLRGFRMVLKIREPRDEYGFVRKYERENRTEFTVPEEPFYLINVFLLILMLGGRETADIIRTNPTDKGIHTSLELPIPYYELSDWIISAYKI